MSDYNLENPSYVSSYDSSNNSSYDSSYDYNTNQTSIKTKGLSKGTIYAIVIVVVAVVVIGLALGLYFGLRDKSVTKSSPSPSSHPNKGLGEFVVTDKSGHAGPSFAPGTELQLKYVPGPSKDSFSGSATFLWSVDGGNTFESLPNPIVGTNHATFQIPLTTWSTTMEFEVKDTKDSKRLLLQTGFTCVPTLTLQSGVGQLPGQSVTVKDTETIVINIDTALPVTKSSDWLFKMNGDVVPIIMMPNQPDNVVKFQYIPKTSGTNATWSLSTTTLVANKYPTELALKSPYPFDIKGEPACPATSSGLNLCKATLKLQDGATGPMYPSAPVTFGFSYSGASISKTDISATYTYTTSTEELNITNIVITDDTVMFDTTLPDVYTRSPQTLSIHTTVASKTISVSDISLQPIILFNAPAATPVYPVNNLEPSANGKIFQVSIYGTFSNFQNWKLIIPGSNAASYELNAKVTSNNQVQLYTSMEQPMFNFNGSKTFTATMSVVASYNGASNTITGVSKTPTTFTATAWSPSLYNFEIQASDGTWIPSRANQTDKNVSITSQGSNNFFTVNGDNGNEYVCAWPSPAPVPPHYEGYACIAASLPNENVSLGAGSDFKVLPNGKGGNVFGLDAENICLVSSLGFNANFEPGSSGNFIASGAGGSQYTQCNAWRFK